jgi:Fanconi anemia group M protein
MDLKVVVDSREYSKSRKIADELEGRGAKILVEELEGGDYYVQGRFLVERKTPSDFVSSVRTGRLWDQVKKLKSAEDVTPIILIEGSPTAFTKYSNWSASAYHGALLSLILGWQVPVYYTPSWLWTADFLLCLAKKAVEEGKGKMHPVSFKPHAETPEEMKRRVIEALPDVGPKLALELLKYFGSVKNVMNASIEELMKVRGIGEGKARKIYDVVNEPL